MVAQHGLQPCDRVQVLQDKGTVRYVGRVDGQNGVWVGIEWDDPSRGKHNGSIGGKKYFECLANAPGGSFVRFEKVNEGITVPEAILLRYQQKEDTDLASNRDMYVKSVSGKLIQVELVGRDEVQKRQSQLHLLKQAKCTGMRVSGVGPGGQLRSACASLTELDLSDNLLSRADTVASLCAELGSLRTLDLSGNRLALPDAVPDSLAPQHWTQLQALVLNHCAVSWPQVVTLQWSLPSLRELHLCDNGIASLAVGGGSGGAALPSAGEESDVDNVASSHSHAGGGASPLDSGSGAGSGGSGAPDDSNGSNGGAGGQRRQAAGVRASAVASSSSGGVHAWQGSTRGQQAFQALEVLNLEGNCIASWEEVLRLQWLPHLSRLHLSGNPLSSIYYPSTAPSAHGTASADTPGVAAPPPSTGQPNSSASKAGAVAVSGTGLGLGPSTGSSGVGTRPAAVPFGCLSALFLGGCQLSGWANVDQLDRFPAPLRELRLSGNPLLQGAKAGGRFEVIARVAGLTALNGADVRPRERRDAELRYLQDVAAATLAPAQQPAPGQGTAGQDRDAEAVAAAARLHPRLAELIRKYGPVVGSGGGAAAPVRALGALAAEVALSCRDEAGAPVGRVLRKRLPLTTTLRALRVLAERLFRVRVADQALLIRPVPSAEWEDAGADEDRQLSYFEPEDGCEVVVAACGDGAARDRAVEHLLRQLAV